MSVIVTTPQGDITHPAGVCVTEYDDGSIYVMPAPSLPLTRPAAADESDMSLPGTVWQVPDGPDPIGYHAAGTFTSWRIELDPEWRLRPTDIPTAPFDLADLRPYVTTVNEYLDTLSKVVTVDGEARTAYQLQQVAVALWLRVEPTRIGQMRYDSRHGSYEKVHYQADASDRRIKPEGQAHLQTDFAYVGHDERIDVTVTILDPHVGEALWQLVGPPLARPFPVIGKRT